MPDAAADKNRHQHRRAEIHENNVGAAGVLLEVAFAEYEQLRQPTPPPGGCTEPFLLPHRQIHWDSLALSLGVSLSSLSRSL